MQLRAGFNDELHAAALQIGRHQTLNLAEQRVSGDGSQLGIGRSGKTQHVLHDAFEAGNLGADDVRVFSRGGHGLQMFLQSVKARLERGERVANFVGDASGQRAEGDEFLLSFEQVLAMHQFGLQRRDHVTVDHPSHGRDQSQQHHNAPGEDAPETGERSTGSGQKLRLRCAMGVGQLPHKITHSIGLGIEGVELRELP